MEIYKPGSPDKWYTLIMDHRGTAYAILDENGAEIGRRQYDAFGVILSQTGTWPTDLAYQTNWQTIQIGNKWWGLSAARVYDFDTGRFTQRDVLPTLEKLYRTGSDSTIGQFDVSIIRSLGVERHLYTYLEILLTSKVDPRGLDPCESWYPNSKHPKCSTTTGYTASNQCTNRKNLKWCDFTATAVEGGPPLPSKISTKVGQVFAEALAAAGEHLYENIACLKHGGCHIACICCSDGDQIYFKKSDDGKHVCDSCIEPVMDREEHVHSKHIATTAQEIIATCEKLCGGK